MVEETREDRIARLQTEHARLDQKLRELDNHVYLSSEDELTSRRLKKMKLAKKDAIALLSELAF